MQGYFTGLLMEQIRNSQEEVYNADYTQVKKSLYL
jgi:hypothetical protein